MALLASVSSSARFSPASGYTTIGMATGNPRSAMDLPTQWTTDSLRSTSSRTTGGSGYDVPATDGAGPDPGDWGSFFAIDAVSLSILWDRLVGITDEIISALVRSSFSTIVRESGDLSAEEAIVECIRAFSGQLDFTHE